MPSDPAEARRHLGWGPPALAILIRFIATRAVELRPNMPSTMRAQI